MLEQSLQFAIEENQIASPFNIHRILIADSLKNWQEYLASLETELKEQVIHIHDNVTNIRLIKDLV